MARWRRVPYVIRPLGTLTSYGLTRRRPWLKRLSVAVLEGPILRHAAAVHFTSEWEWDEIKPLNLSLREVVIPLAVRSEARGDAQRLLAGLSVFGRPSEFCSISRVWIPKKTLNAFFGPSHLSEHSGMTSRL